MTGFILSGWQVNDCSERLESANMYWVLHREAREYRWARTS
jgi:hypothetical protein